MWHSMKYGDNMIVSFHLKITILLNFYLNILNN